MGAPCLSPVECTEHIMHGVVPHIKGVWATAMHVLLSIAAMLPVLQWVTCMTVLSAECIVSPSGLPVSSQPPNTAKLGCGMSLKECLPMQH